MTTKRSFLTTVARVTALAAMLTLAGGGPAAAAPRETSAALDLARQLNQAFIEVADQVSPAVVVIRVAHKQPRASLEDGDNPFFDQLPREFRRWFENQRERQRENDGDRERPRSPHREPVWDGQGSGVVIREEGYILTNGHVVEGADKIEVRFKDGAKFEAEVRGTDSQSDVAVLKIDPKGKKLTVAKLGDSDKTRVGEFAIAIGAPFELDYSVTFGHVSAKGRSRIIQDAAMDQDFIQTDANINPGNSGGPLVNINGEVIGINTLIRGLRSGIGFAIPVNFAKEVSTRLIADGKYVRAWLGVAIDALAEQPAEFRDMVQGVAEGVVVRQIQPGGPASKSELKPSDVITAVDGRAVSTPQQLKSEVRGKKIGAPVTLNVHRFGKNIQVKVKPEAWPDEVVPVANSRPAPAEAETAKTFGLTVQSVDKQLTEKFDLDDKAEGVVVTEVERGSEAERKGLRAGDLITEVNQKPVTTPRQFRDAMKAADPKKGVLLNFTSRGTSKFEVLKSSGE
jgi:serine protease Do